MAVLSIGQVWAADPAAVGTTLFSEDFSGYAKDAVPSGSVTTATGRVVYGGANVTYSVTNGSGTTKIYTENSAGGTSPEILVGKSNGTLTIAGIPSGGAKAITVSYKQNKQKLKVESTTTGYSGSKDEKPSSVGANSVDITIADGSAETFTLVFTCTGSSNVRVDDILVTVKTAGEGGSSTPTCATPTFDPEDGETFDESISVELATTTDGATIYYTTDGNDPTTSSSVYSTALNFTETTTVKAIAAKEGSNNSAVASATYTKIVSVPGYNIDFESDLVSYVDWEFSNLTKTNETIKGHGNSTYYAKTNGTGTASATTKAKIATPGVLTYYVSKIGTNTNASSYWYVEVSSDGSEWTKVGGDKAAAVGITQGTWTEYSADLSEYTNVYVRVYYKGTTAIRAIDDIELAMASDIAKPTISGTDNFLTSSEISMACTTEGADIYYTLDGTDPKSGTKYTAAFSIEETKTIKAIAKLGDDWSDVVVATFTKATVMTVAQALAASEGANQYVKGIISSIDEVSTEHGNATYYLKDEGQENSIKIYRGKYLNNTNFTAVDQIILGDEVTVTGTISVYSEVNQFAQGNYIVAMKPVARLAWSTDSYEADLSGSNTFPSLTNTNGVTVAYSSSEESAATIDPATGEISLVAVGSTTITASFAGNEDYKANSVSYTLNVSNSVLRADISFEENGGSEVADLTNQSNLPDPLPTITKAGKNFGGWWTTSTFEDGTQAVAGAAVESTDPITLYAKWLEPYTVAEALAMIAAMSDNETAENSIYVQGIVCVAPEAAPNSGRLTYYISANGNPDPVSNQFQIYLGYGVSGANFTAQTDVQLEDAVVAYGKLKKYVKSAVVYPEFDKGSQLYSLVRKADPELAWSETSFNAYIGESNTFPTLTNDHNVAVTYSSTETDYATISNEEGHEGEITLVAVGTTTIKATFAGDEDYKAAEVSYTLNVYNPITAGTITYEENGGSEVADVETPVDNLPDPLPTPTKENNIFAGWWTTSTFEDGTQAVAGAPMNGDITLYAKWIEIPYYATVYTSNVGFVGGGDSHEANSKVSIAETEYDAQKVGSSSKGGTITVTVPAKTNTLHFHVFTWKNKSNQITVSGALTNLSASTIDVDGDDAGGGSGTYTIESNPVDHYRVITFDAVEAETEITFTSPASGEQRFIMYGINQEGGVYPVLDHIVITGEATELTYEIGDEFNPAGLGVNAIYTLEEVEQTPVAVDAADIEWSFDPAYIAGETTSVTVTATYNEKSANKTVTGIIVNVPAPEILVNPASVAFGNVNQDDVVEAEVINVTLKSVENATIALSGDVAAFTLDKEALTANGTISVTPVTSVAGTFAATITISDDASAAESKEVALSMTVKAPEIPDVCDGTDDFATIDKTVSATGYATRTTTDGWVGTNVRFQEIDEKMYWKINGKTTAVGTITSPVLSDGIATLKFRYANTDNESNGVSVKIEIKQSGDVVKEYTLTKANSEVTKDEVYTEIIENINVAGDFQIVFTNLSPSNSTSNKDRVAIGRLCWTGYTAAPEPTPDYTRDVTNGHYGTICLPKAGTIEGATLYEIGSFESNMIYIDEVGTTLTAGVPYIFYASEAQLNVYYTDKTADDVPAGEANGLFGFYNLNDEDATFDIPEGEGNYILYNDQYWLVSGRAAYIANYRAYIKIGSIVPKSAAPGRRRVAMAVNGENAAQGIEDVQGDNVQSTKVLINGNLYILRGEKQYDATGRLVK